MKKEIQSKVIFIALFAIIGFGAMKVPFSQLLGAEGLRFSLFDFYGPIAGGFIGSTLGLATVGLMQLIGWAAKGFPTEIGALIRLLPMLFAVLYFAKRSRWILMVPAVAMIAFWAHPEGRQAWYFALYWLVPMVMYFFHEKFIFARALGSAFTAHGVGGALWIWGFNMKATIWLSLVPIVWKERMLMAGGITLTYILFNFIMSLVLKKTRIKLPFVKLNPKYTIGPNQSV